MGTTGTESVKIMVPTLTNELIWRYVKKLEKRIGQLEAHITKTVTPAESEKMLGGTFSTKKKSSQLLDTLDWDQLKDELDERGFGFEIFDKQKRKNKIKEKRK